MFTALLDTCMPWPNGPIWSATILDELAYEEERKLTVRGGTLSPR